MLSIVPIARARRRNIASLHNFSNNRIHHIPYTSAMRGSYMVCIPCASPYTLATRELQNLIRNEDCAPVRTRERGKRRVWTIPL